ncbi:hypothetical protein AMJ49_04685 [Parcubacteria bacterium DG_74_2]|nr:MAG: hypothetical protein AMJ49_04685 [Parcubacteria bacterium DG_74_2]
MKSKIQNPRLVRRADSSRRAKSKNKGFTLLEITITVFVLIASLVGVSSVFSRLTSQASFNSSRLIAVYLAQEGIELVRNIRDGNWLEDADWDEGLNSCSGPTGCEIDYNNFNNPGAEDPNLQLYANRFLKINDNGFYNYSSGADTKFKRKITITKIAADELKVSVTVEWPKGSVTVQEHLYNWK